MAPLCRATLLLIAAALCTGFVEGVDNDSALQLWTMLKYGYSLPGQWDAMSLLEAQGIHPISEVAINEELFFNGASCGTCVIYRDLSKNENIQWPWSVGVVSQSCAECKADISLGILRSQDDRAIEWMPALCTPGNATLFYVIRQNASSSDAMLTVVNSRLPIIKVESLANNGSWVPLHRDSRLLGTFKAFRRSEMSLRVRLTSIFGTVIEDLIPGDSGGFGRTQFLPVAPVYQLPVSSHPLRTTRNILSVVEPQQQQEREAPGQQATRQTSASAPVSATVPAQSPNPAPAPSPAVALFNSTLIQLYNQCGGITNCPFQEQGGPCEDKQYFACADPSTVCVRINAYYWQCRHPQLARAPASAIATGGEPQQGYAGSSEVANAPLPAAMSPSPAAAPSQAGPFMDDGAFYPPGCTASSTDARCLFGRRLLDSAVSPAAAAAASTLAPAPGADTEYISIPQQLGKHLLDTSAEASRLALSDPAVRRHLTQAAGAPAPALTAGGPVADYGACGGTGSSCPLPRALCKDEAYLRCANKHSGCVRLSSYYWQCQPGIIAGVVNPIAPGVPSQAPASASSLAGRSNQGPSPTPVTSAGDSSMATPFVIDPTLMMQPTLQTSADMTDAYVRDFGRCGGTAGYCPPGQNCTDAANLECSPASDCVRISLYYWQCRPKKEGSISGLAGRRLHAAASQVEAEPPTPSHFGPLPGPKIKPQPQPVPWGSSADSSNVPDFGMCGGIAADSCPLAVPAACTDSQYLDCASTTSKLWQCVPKKIPPTPASGLSTARPLVATLEDAAPVPSPQPAVKPAPKGNNSFSPDYFQCGGAGDACPLSNRALCMDTQYLDCKPETSRCVRQSKWYWQCLPIIPVSPPPAGRPATSASLGSHSTGRRLHQAAAVEPQAAAKSAPLTSPQPLAPFGRRAADFAICGGTGSTCPLTNRTLCTDSHYLDCASSSFHCQRQTEYYWQCAPVPAPAKPGAPQPSLQLGSTTGIYLQCGGQGGSCPLADRSKCIDTQYLNCASDSLQCVRQSEWYWQCLPKAAHAPQPLPKAAVAPVPYSGRRHLLADAPPLLGPQPAAQAPRAEYLQCGGAGNTCPLANRTLCTDSAYLQCAPGTICTRLSQWYWQCLAPAPHTPGRRLHAQAPRAEAPTLAEGPVHAEAPWARAPKAEAPMHAKPPMPAEAPKAEAPMRAEAPRAESPMRAEAPMPKAGAVEAPHPAPLPRAGVPEYAQCGGAGESCPLSDRKLCKDTQYLTCAAEGFHCQRQSRWYYQCLPEIAPAPHVSGGRRLQQQAAAKHSVVTPIPEWLQCGGAGDTCPLANRTLCTDSQYLQCAPGTFCTRLSNWYWQCLPAAPGPQSTGRRLQAEAFTRAEAPKAEAPTHAQAPMPKAEFPMHAEAPKIEGTLRAEAPMLKAEAPMRAEAPKAIAPMHAEAPMPNAKAPLHAEAPKAEAPAAKTGPHGAPHPALPPRESCPLSNRTLCRDAQYLDCAAEGFQCQRQSQWYWQCVQLRLPEVAPAPHVGAGRRLQAMAAKPPMPSTFANRTKVGDYQQCGGVSTCPLADAALCTDSQYLACASSKSQCIRMSMDFWECLPNEFVKPITPPGVPLPTLPPFTLQSPPPPPGTIGGRRLAQDIQVPTPDTSVIAKEGDVCGGWGPWCQSQYGASACASNKQVVPCEPATTCVLISGDIMQCIHKQE
ncbi:probable glycyl-glycine endopeptidase ALE-1 at C-terminar half [Coccomyxa sp. Obi]|nr:probable glycyl-glycine endopeptidase ALE-1 at C-terminar half [Coccomyxa sp. Obi]